MISKLNFDTYSDNHRFYWRSIVCEEIEGKILFISYASMRLFIDRDACERKTDTNFNVFVIIGIHRFSSMHVQGFIYSHMKDNQSWLTEYRFQTYHLYTVAHENI